MRWLDGKTAPKDGTAIIAHFGHLPRPVIAWYSHRRRISSSAPRWVVSHSTTFTSSMPSEPDHWMPIPPFDEDET